MKTIATRILLVISSMALMIGIPVAVVWFLYRVNEYAILGLAVIVAVGMVAGFTYVFWELWGPVVKNKKEGKEE